MSTIRLLGDLAPAGLTHISFPDTPSAGPVLTLANLEVPFCPAALPAAPKSGPHLRAEPALLSGVARAFSPLVVSLANNHSMDFGAAGLEHTLAAAAAAGVRVVGAGPSPAAAAAPLVVDLAGRRIGLVAATDRWFGLASAGRSGTAPLEGAFAGRIRRLRPEADFVIATVHGGGEVSPWPSPRWQQQLRALAEAGADLVHAHHPHVPLGWEAWAGSWIFYGLGNTLVSPARWPGPACTRRSWRVELDPAAPHLPPRVSAWEVAPAADGGATLRCVQAGVDADDPAVAALNTPLGDPALLEGLHQEYAVRLWESFYADRLNPGDTAGRRMRLLARTVRDTALAWFRPQRWRTLRRDRGLFHYHLFASATHADEIATALGVLHGELADRRDARTRALATEWLPAALFGP